MFELDGLISGLGPGHGPAAVAAVGLLLGLRHATDPDHLVAVSTLVAAEGERPRRRAAALGLAWGAGHATSLLALGVPFVLTAALLPRPVQRAAEAAVGVIVMALAWRLYRRWRLGAFHVHAHRHGAVVHRHLHPHAATQAHEHGHPTRSPAVAYAVGAAHGLAGSAGVVLLLLAGAGDRGVAAAALVAFAFAAAAGMAAFSSLLGIVLGSRRMERRFRRAIPAAAAAAFVIGSLWCAAALAGVVR